MKNYAEMTASEMVTLYNKRTGKDVKRFASRADGIRRLEKLDAEEPKVVELVGTDVSSVSATFNGVDKAFAVTSASRSEGIRRSWSNPEIRAKRSERHGVVVDGEEFKSVGEAFRTFGLPSNERIKFRMLLKDAGSLSAYGMNWEMFSH